MDPTFDPVEILCPRCGEGVAAWELLSADDAAMGTPSSRERVRCPHCRAAVPLDAAQLHQDGLIEVGLRR
jgi:endogenous inhibitor of DNA gyrase (YacG/DUF329 family)